MKSYATNDVSTNYQLKEVRIKLVLNENDSLTSKEPIDSPQKAVACLGDFLKELDRETLCVINLNNALEPIHYNIVSIGAINRSVTSIPNIYKSAILSNAHSIIVMHNHPSGNIKPSNDDLNITKRLIEVGKLMEIPVQDHVIVGAVNGDLYSMRLNNSELFNDELNMDIIHHVGSIKRLQEVKPISFVNEVAEAAAKKESEEKAVGSDRTSKGIEIPEK